MKEQNFGESKQQEPFDLEKRLTAYYGPPLRERPLPPASWENLRLRLGPQEDGRRRRGLRMPLPRKRSRASVPASIQDAFDRITHQARVASTPLMLRCYLKPRMHEPAVRCSWLVGRKLLLLLPLNAVMTMGQAELDVLLATGLARSIASRKPAFILGRLLLATILLIACAALILFWMHHLPFLGFPLAIALCAGVVWLLHMQTRSLAFHADTLVVRWLGRERACSGLHELADRSRTPGRRRWGEPSLTERIERVCGTRVEAREKHLTLVG